MSNSKYYTIFQYKNEFRIKYFNETFALILGYKQKDLINEKIDVLMPKEFCKSHQNMIKKLLIYEQIKYSNPDKGFIFDSSGRIMYTIKVEGIMIYELSRHLMFISEIYFIQDKEYKFMLNNNFELLAFSKNFGDEYSINYNIFHNFNLKIIDVFKIKPNKIYQNFAEQFNNIHYQKYIRQGKVEEYFTPQLYVPQGEKNIGIMNPNYFNTIKNNILSKIIGNNKDNNNIIENKNDKEDEIDKLINNEKSQKVINDFFFNTSQINFHSTFKYTLNKKKFIEYLSKELSKIPDIDLMFEGDKDNYNLIVKSKNLIRKLLMKKELIYTFIEIQVKLNYMYEKPFYFISAYDKKKLHFKLNKSEKFLNNISLSSINSPVKNAKNKNKNFSKYLSIKKRFLKRQNVIQSNMDKKDSIIAIENNNNPAINTSIIKIIPINQINNVNYNLDNNYEHCESFENDKILEKIEKYKKKINNEKFIITIKYILSIICIIVLIIYILIMYYQRNVIDLIHKSFQCYYYNLYTKNLILHYQTLIIEKFYNTSKLSKNTFTTEAHYKFVITVLTPILKDTFHSFTNLYFEYNLNLEKDINLMYTQRQFKKIGGFWEEINYISDYSTEMDTVIYNIYSILDIDESEEEIMKDINNFIFKNGINKKNNKDRINSSFIKLMYYFIINYELTWKDIFDQIDEIIIDNYQNYVEYKLKINYGLEIIGLSFIVIFYIFVIIYLFYANNIIIKNIIFLFLDFSDDNLKSIGNNTTKIMMIKLLEFKNCIFDFSLEKLSLYSKNLENIEQNKYNSVSTIFKNYTGVNSTFERSDSINSDNKSIMSNNIEKRQHLSFKKNEE